MAIAAALFFLTVGIALVLARHPFATLQANILGGRITPGCVVVEAALVIVLAVLFVVFREWLR